MEKNLDSFHSEAIQPKIETPKKVFTQEELRDRYEKPFRDIKAREFREARNTLQKQMDEERVKVLHEKFDQQAMLTDSAAQRRLKVDTSKKIAEGLSMKKADLDAITLEQDSRSSVKKLWYKITSDPLTEKRKLAEESFRVLEKELETVEAKKAEIQEFFSEGISQTERVSSRKHEEIVDTFSEPKKELLNKVREVNRSSRDAIKNTLEQLNNGDLNISKLAKEANAIVIHTLPLEGWRMRNTAPGNTEVDTINMSPAKKIETIGLVQPDLSATIVSADEKIKKHHIMYPFGLILDGSIVSSYRKDALTITNKDAKIRNPNIHGDALPGSSTLLADTVSEFKDIARSGYYGEPSRTPWNESIVSRPKIKAIFLDQEDLSTAGYSVPVTEYFPVEEEADVRKKYGHRINSTRFETPTEGKYAGKKVFVIDRTMPGMEKALAYATDNYPELPVYIRKEDGGIFTRDGKKVTAEEIYS